MAARGAFLRLVLVPVPFFFLRLRGGGWTLAPFFSSFVMFEKLAALVNLFLLLLALRAMLNARLLHSSAKVFLDTCMYFASTLENLTWSMLMLALTMFFQESKFKGTIRGDHRFYPKLFAATCKGGTNNRSHVKI